MRKYTEEIDDIQQKVTGQNVETNKPSLVKPKITVSKAPTINDEFELPRGFTMHLNSNIASISENELEDHEDEMRQSIDDER